MSGYLLMGCPQDALFESVNAGRHGMICTDGPRDPLTAAMLRALPTPYLAVVSTNVGPGKYRAAHALREWADLCVLHATVEQRCDYEVISDLTQRHDRVLLVESKGSIARLWFHFLQQRRPTMGLIAEGPAL